MLKSKLLLTTALATGLLVTGMAAPLVVGFANVAVAAEGSGGEGSGGQGAGGQGQGGSGSHSDSETHDDSDHDDSDHDDSDHGSGGANAGGANSAGQHGQDNQGGGQGQGGPDDTSDGVGPQAGWPSHDDDGGKPAWAQEGIPEIELGRLNVARSPEKVLDQAYAEALLALPASAEFYNQSLEDIKVALANDWDNLTLVDSPLSNLAMLKDAMDGSIDLSSAGITNDAFTLAAVFLGIASDKTVPITEDTVLALSVIFDVPVSDAYIATLAYHAEEVREAVLEGHG